MSTVLKVQVQIVVEPDDGGFYAYIPELRGVHAPGDSEKDAIENAKDAAIAYLESLLRNGEPLPLCAKRQEISWAGVMDAFRNLVTERFGRKSHVYRIEELSLAA